LNFVIRVAARGSPDSTRQRPGRYDQTTARRRPGDGQTRGIWPRLELIADDLDDQTCSSGHLTRWNTSSPDLPLAQVVVFAVMLFKYCHDYLQCYTLADSPRLGFLCQWVVQFLTLGPGAARLTIPRSPTGSAELAVGVITAVALERTYVLDPWSWGA